MINIALSSIAIIISIAAIIISDKTSKSINKKNLNSHFFEKIYFNYIIEALPTLLNKVSYSNGKIELDYDEFSRIIYEMLEKSKFYKYFDNPFYEQTKDILVELDEFTINLANLNNISYELYEKKIINLESLTSKLYKHLNYYYSKV